MVHADGQTEIETFTFVSWVLLYAKNAYIVFIFVCLKARRNARILLNMHLV